MKSIISYNVNGIRAAIRKGFAEWLQNTSPDILCLQESKAQPEQLEPETLQPEGYYAYWYSAEKKGYSGVAIFSKEEPKHIAYGCGIEKYDKEGRIIRADYDNYSVMSVYIPSGSSGDHRQAVKDVFLEDFYQYIRELLMEKKRIIIAGDYNICHKPIDIHDPVRNKNSSGFLPHEREWMTKFVELGFLDSFRRFNQEPGNYSWWSYRGRARENNKGWRIDYQMVSDGLAEQCVGAGILPEVPYSDHCPITLDLAV